MYDKLLLDCPKPEITIKKGLFGSLEQEDDIIHIVLIATKPDIIKLAPLILELKARKKKVLVVHSGQHYDWNLSGGLEKEFGITVDINLNVAGKLYEQQSQIIYKLGYVIAELKKAGKTVIPYTLGDTTTAVAGGNASFMNLVGVAHVEAGLRTMTPPKEIFLNIHHGNLRVVDYHEELMQNGNWQKGSYEPFPEQFNTRAAAPSAGIHFAPVHLNAKHLSDEGFSGEKIFIVGNLVSDALELIKKRKKGAIFKKYPLLESGEIVRFCVHRRENVSSYHRFKSIFEALVDLVEEGRKVLLVSLNATEKALATFGFKERIMELSKKCKNFIYSDVWPYYSDVVYAMEKCSVVVTDSGSIQEEANILGVPCVTLRFNTDRPETVFAGSNILAPPVNSKIISSIINEVIENKELHTRMSRTGNLYGTNVSGKITSIIDKMDKSRSLFELFEQDRLGLTKLSFWEKGEMSW